MAATIALLAYFSSQSAFLPQRILVLNLLPVPI